MLQANWYIAINY